MMSLVLVVYLFIARSFDFSGPHEKGRGVDYQDERSCGVLFSFPFLVRTLSPKPLVSKWSFDIYFKNNSSLTTDEKIIELINKITTTGLNLILKSSHFSWESCGGPFPRMEAVRKLRNKAGLQQPIESGKSNRFKPTHSGPTAAVRAPGQVQPKLSCCRNCLHTTMMETAKKLLLQNLTLKV